MHNQPLNYLRQASAELQQDWLPWISKSHPQDALACQKLLHDAHGAVKFLLPRGGRLLNDRLRGLPEVPRLPFPAIVLEYESDKHGQGIVEQVYERTPVSCPRRIVVAWHEAAAPGTSTGEGGQRTSHGLHLRPREHLRRGHIRIYANGRRIWINPTLVNAGVGGKISTVRDLRRAT